MNEKVKEAREPLFHITRRASISGKKAWLIRVLSVIAAVLVSSVLTIFLTGLSPVDVFVSMFQGAFGSERRVWALLQELAMLLCVSLAVTPAFKMRFWNIGAEGQVLAGALATAACMLFLDDVLPVWLVPVVMIAAGVLAGAVWGLVPALFKAKWNTNETLFTLMMNYIAIQLTAFYVYKWSTPKGSGHVGIINSSTNIGWLPPLFGKNYLINIIVVLAVTVFMFVYLRYSKHGYEITVVGSSENTAKYIGINVKKVIIRTMLLSGAICGLAGYLLVSGTGHTISTDTAGGRGFTAIMVSWLAKFDPRYMILTAFIIVFLEKGAIEISSSLHLNDSFSDIITGIIIFFIIGSEFFIRYQIHGRAGKEGK